MPPIFCGMHSPSGCLWPTEWLKELIVGDLLWGLNTQEHVTSPRGGISPSWQLMTLLLSDSTKQRLLLAPAVKILGSSAVYTFILFFVNQKFIPVPLSTILCERVSYLLQYRLNLWIILFPPQSPQDIFLSILRIFRWSDMFRTAIPSQQLWTFNSCLQIALGSSLKWIILVLLTWKCDRPFRMISSFLLKISHSDEMKRLNWIFLVVLEVGLGMLRL